MRAAVLHQKQDDGVVIEEVAFLWAERAYVLAHVIRPKNAAGPRPAMVIAPDRLGHYTRRGMHEMVYRLAREGRLVLSIDDPHITRRNAPEAGLYAVAGAAGTSVIQIRVFDVLRGLDYLLTRPDVDPGRIGLVGLGAGEETARIARALEPRFANPSSVVGPLTCGKPENPDFSMLRWMQRQIERQQATRPAVLASADAWRLARGKMVRWLASACPVKTGQQGVGKVTGRSQLGKLVVETLALPLEAGLSCPARLVHQLAVSGQKSGAVILSHDGRQSISTPQIAEAAERLAAHGYWVILPEHASPDLQSLQPIEESQLQAFHQLADRAGWPPLALRVSEDLAAFRYLAGRSEVDSERIVAAGRGIGGIDACLAALIEPRIAGVASIDATTLRDWAVNVAPEEEDFWSILPYLPGMLATADLDLFYAALAPRQLVLAKLRDGWPKSGFQQVTTAATSAYGLEDAKKALVVISPREALEEREKRTPEGIERQLIAAARGLLPAPPVPGLIGTPELVKTRGIVDSATALVWLVEIQGGIEQEFIDGGYRLATWSFFNSKGPKQQGRQVTPLIFKKEGRFAYRLTGIGRTRANTGAGLQTHPFELAAGSDAVGSGYFFGFYTGDPAGAGNAGVVEFDQLLPQDRMTVLAGDEGPRVTLGTIYREQTSYPRTYSIHAVSIRK
jgi:dienelactone hydrolase